MEVLASWACAALNAAIRAGDQSKSLMPCVCKVAVALSKGSMMEAKLGRAGSRGL